MKRPSNTDERRNDSMSNEDRRPVEGKVVEVPFANAIVRVVKRTRATQFLAHVSGKMRMHRIRIFRETGHDAALSLGPDPRSDHVPVK